MEIVATRNQSDIMHYSFFYLCISRIIVGSSSFYAVYTEIDPDD